ncbi:lipocalin family protein [Marilutibacter spongiae]|uniref:Outer membrane lipoprotein Blc n=1 Tax=Marilutibacter spongiae TaxID=2025720 RepID=A0A7W3TKN6_9GAMM|nr:lipocalin family protein [Lysobacter spongiae]MBB1059844.1 lipocalin family protein [Lysobacter spongiae]
MTRDTPPDTVTGLELDRYLGTWFEIARLPMRHEPEDYTDISAHYSLKADGKVRVQNRALDGNGELQESIGEASLATPGDASRLEVTFLPEGLRWIPFTRGDYWILRIEPDYSVALVGSPDRDYLWLLARQPAMGPAKRQDFLATARAQGYRLDALIDTPHTGRPTAEPTT